MSSSVPPRRIASNWLWRDGRLSRDPLVELSADGSLLSCVRCEAPDREPFTEFYAGVLVAGFPSDWRGAFEWLRARRERPLAELLEALPRPDAGGVWVLLSGLDYASMRLTDRSRIRLL